MHVARLTLLLVALLFAGTWWALVAGASAGAADRSTRGTHPGDPGRRLLAQSCLACHRVDGAGGRLASDLEDVLARRGAPYVRHLLVDEASWHRLPDDTLDVVDVLAALETAAGSGRSWP